MFKLLRRHDKVQTGLKRSREFWLARVTQIGQRSRLDDALWEELEELLISADVGVATTAQIIERVREEASAHRLTDSSDAIELLKQEMVSLLSPKDTAIDNGQLPVSGGPMVILAMGVNGVGKTTSVAKLAHYFKEQGNRVLLAASDTFRAAAIDQLQAWGQLVGVDVIAHNPGGDPAAIAYDALEAARARGANVVLVDTAGRLHTKLNLM
ncbi:MAG: signal recognition particle receptor subunit alpha, partial [Dehalococcoidia bacterium]|nr:signal recognition particle receptor subunit alpha [Dehalococcoidia bacterium]